jgi:aryl-alcohol dehydrogenase-like predicted oxidoreductase
MARRRTRGQTMERRSLSDGTCLSVLGIGCSRVGSISNSVSIGQIEATLDAAVEAGINFFDTANIYGQGDSERALGRLLRRHRGRTFVVTKVGGRHPRYAGLIRLAKPLLRIVTHSRPKLQGAVVQARTATVVHDFSPADLRPAIDGCRRRLGLDQLDGLLLHSPYTSRKLVISWRRCCTAAKRRGSEPLWTRSLRSRQRCPSQHSA